MHQLFWQTIGFLGGIIYCSLFEWLLHRYVMHRPLGFFRYPFQAHTIVHHQTFRADDSYHLKQETDKQTVPMAWWNAPAIWLLHVGPVLGLQWLVGQPIAWGTFAALVGYYAAYEYMHWCMHIPRQRHVERSGIFYRLNGHHLLHHRYMGKNFNVVLPLFDALFGTLVLRSPVKFAQVTGHAVPDVQPRPQST
jgi:hypothetical protein